MSSTTPPEWYRPARYPTLLLILAMAACSAGFAWLTYGLINLAMTNVAHLTMEGLLTAMSGDIMQLTIIAAKGLAAMLLYLGFKGIEHELTYRWLGHH
jgi:uncharacterized membrane protein YjjP (DUF1212 family)